MSIQRSVRKVAKSALEHPSVLRLRRRGSLPFADGNDRVVMHCCHHRVGTSWFSNVMRGIAKEFCLPYVANDQSLIPSGSAVFFNSHSRVNLGELDGYSGSHMIRDPRDMVVSGYHFHLWTEEPWANVPMGELDEVWALVPMDEFGHMTYKAYLNSLDTEAGLAAEIGRVSAVGMKDMMAWNYENPHFYEFKYEDIMVDEDRVMREIFSHFGFAEDAIESAMTVAAQFSFGSRTGRSVGDVGTKSHMRSGRSGQWKNEFTVAHVDLFKEIHGADLIALGYEQDLDWSLD